MVSAAAQQEALGARRLPNRVLPLRSVPSPSLITVFATVTRFHPEARVHFAQSSPGPYAALRAAASGLALASGLHLVPLVAR